MAKNIKGVNKKQTKKVVQIQELNYEKETPVWCFDKVDIDGQFRFSHEAINCPFIIEKFILFNKMTWADINRATHDNGKDKNHYLDYNGISPEGKARIKAKGISDEDYDTIYSIALTNMLRLIGLKKNRIFHVIWYDKKHEFYRSSR
jgi:hypothetical protein